ncbi:MAG: OmpA family protein [Burkholderiaceae bacterium]|nr:MAG: OmpA family protein [Burkholderiaceae bacterium]
MSRRTLSVGVLACALGACALISGRDESAAPQPASEPFRGPRHLAQLDFGQRARFAECVEPGCPARTPKTIATAPDREPPKPTPADAPLGLPVAPEPPPAAPAVAPSVPAAATKRLTLLFALGSATLTGEHRARLRSALPDLQHSDRIVVAGRTDDLGSEALNQSLALARGLAVRDYLLDIDPQLPARIAIDARGRCCYVVPNDDARSRSRNRRVEVAYDPASGTAP